MQDISKELQTIRDGRYGIDIRDDIHDALDKLAGVDISKELEIIKSDPYGINVKNAIYSALNKLNNSKTPSKDIGIPEIIYYIFNKVQDPKILILSKEED